VETYDTHFDLERIFDTVRLLRKHWDRRAQNMQFYTLGKTVYLDGNTPTYYSCQTGVNQILLKHFGSMT
jgi:cytolysin (calcineurin-like family phosphatase)